MGLDMADLLLGAAAGYLLMDHLRKVFPNKSRSASKPPQAEGYVDSCDSADTAGSAVTVIHWAPHMENWVTHNDSGDRSFQLARNCKWESLHSRPYAGRQEGILQATIKQASSRPKRTCCLQTFILPTVGHNPIVYLRTGDPLCV